jgi:hypothetical protein
MDTYDGLIISLIMASIFFKSASETHYSAWSQQQRTPPLCLEGVCVNLVNKK